MENKKLNSGNVPSSDEIQNTYADFLNLEVFDRAGWSKFKTINELQKLFMLQNFIFAQPENVLSAKLELKLRVFEYMVHLYGFDSLPKIVSDKLFANLDSISSPNFEKNQNNQKKDKKEYFRGTGNIENHFNLLSSDSYHTGIGISASGIHVTADIAEANFYATNQTTQQSKHVDEKVLRLKIVGEKIIEESALMVLRNLFFFAEKETDFGDTFLQAKYNVFWYFVSMLGADEQKLVLNLFKNDDGMFATFLGYDAISLFNNDNVCILNRGAIAVSKKEFERIQSVFEKQRA